MDAAQVKKKLEEWNRFISEVKENKEAEPPDFSEVVIPHKEELIKTLKKFKETKEIRLLKKCSLLLKFAYENIDLLNNIPHSQEVKEALSLGFLKTPIEGDEGLSERLKKLGINNRYAEGKVLPGQRMVPVEEGGKLVFIEESSLEKRNTIKKELHDLALRIQLMNAKRQIMELPEKEEKEYEELQKRYIELSKKLESLG